MMTLLRTISNRWKLLSDRLLESGEELLSLVLGQCAIRSSQPIQQGSNLVKLYQSTNCFLSLLKCQICSLCSLKIILSQTRFSLICLLELIIYSCQLLSRIHEVFVGLLAFSIQFLILILHVL